MFRKYRGRWVVLAVLTLTFIILLSRMDWWTFLLRLLFPGDTSVIYPRADLRQLVGEHLRLVLISSGLTVLIGVPLGIGVTRPRGSSFLPVVNDLTSFGQTFPPVAILALSVPLLGYGLLSTIVALFLYGLLPVVRNSIAGFKAVPRDMREAAAGIGMSPVQILGRVEFPLAASAIFAGIRISVVINVGTAMIGAVIGAGGLGSPIIAGLVQYNVAYIIEGAVPAAILAVLLDLLLANIQSEFKYPGR